MGCIALGVFEPGIQPAEYQCLKLSITKSIRNGGVQGCRRIGLYEFPDNYLVRNNLITGNFSRFNGGAISHWGIAVA